MQEAQPHFIAILPRGELQSKILDCKSAVQRAVGDQMYLTDPPHLTVFLASFQDRNLLCDTLELVTGGLKSPRIRIEGWHVFENDCLTGNNTLVMKINDSDKETLRAIQALIIRCVAGQREKTASLARFQAAWPTLSQERQRSVEEFGFPFIGSDWQPHFTIASIRPSDWVNASKDLMNRPVVGCFQAFELALFSLEGKKPNLVQVFKLGSASTLE